MEIIISQLALKWGLIIAASICAFFAGRATNDRDKIIEHTIKYLVDQGFVKHRLTESGEIDIVPLDEEKS